MNTYTQPTTTAPNFESVWAILQETAKSQKESDKQRKENERILNEKFAETDRLIKETAKEMKETARSQKETDRQMKELRKQLGGIGDSQGSFAEEYFFNSFKKRKKTFFGKKFDDIDKNLKGRLKDLKAEYDIVLYNSDSVAIIEVKFKVREEHIEKLIKKAETFRIIYPYYKDFNVYLGLASMVFPADLEEDCRKEGIAVIKQVGDMVVIHDENLRVF